LAKLIAGLILIVGMYGLRAADLHETVRKSIPAEHIEKVVVNSTNGSIIVTSWAKDSIAVVAHKKLDGSGEKAWQMLKSIKIFTEIQGHSLKLYSEIPRVQSHGWMHWLLGLGIKNFRVSWEITVPNGMQVEAASTNGDIELDDLQNVISATATNGTINALRIKGPADLHSTNGDIHIYYVELPQKGHIDISTTNGKIELILPLQANCRISAYSTNGQISCDLSNMHQTERRKRSLTTVVGHGGIPVNLETTNGDISIFNK